jgi:hypothetical protein
MSVDDRVVGPLTDRQRATFAEIADVLIPRANGMPAATEIEMGSAQLASVLGWVPNSVEELCDVLDSAAGRPPDEVVTELERDAPGRLSLLLSVAAGTYYSCAEVAGLLGYRGQRALPLRPDPDLDELVRPVLDRYRSSPPSVTP